MDAKDHPFTMHSLSLLLPQGSFICQDTNCEFVAWAPRPGVWGEGGTWDGKANEFTFQITSRS